MASSNSTARSKRRTETVVANQGGGLLTIPLIPHHVQHHRRLSELSLVEAASLSRHIWNHTERPRLYPRRKLQAATTTSNSRRAEQKERRQHQVVSLYQGFGTHYADLWCGTPPQRQTVIVDTGSATTAFACSGCSPLRCGRLDRYHIDPPFREYQSTSFQKLSCADCFLGDCNAEDDECAFGVSYQEGSNWTAYEAVDKCYVGGMHQHPLTAPADVVGVDENNNNMDGLDPRKAADFSFDLRFGCQTKMTGHFRTQLADGIMGMDIGKPAIWNQMFLQGKIASRSFSLCFTRQADARRSGTESGAMTLGGTDKRLHSTDMVYSATNLDGAGFFSVQLHKIYLRYGGIDDDSILSTDLASVVPLHITESLMNEGQVIIDSGTTDSYFVHHLGEPFKEAWLSVVGTPYTNNPISLSEEELHKLPTIILQFKGDTVSNTDFDMLSTKNVPLARDLDPENPYDVILAVPPSHYYEYQPSLGMYIPGLYFDEPDGSVLGANVMMLHNIFFDVEHYRIGWAESFCDYTKLVSPFVEKKTTTTDVLPGEPYKGQKLRVHRPFHNDNERPLTTHVSAFAKVGLSSRVRPSFCSSATCQIGSAIGVLLVILATVVIVFALKTKLTRAREVRQRSNFRKPPAANHSTLKLRSPTESESDVSIHVRGKDFTKGVILRSRSTQIIV